MCSAGRLDSGDDVWRHHIVVGEHLQLDAPGAEIAILSQGQTVRAKPE